MDLLFLAILTVSNQCRTSAGLSPKGELSKSDQRMPGQTNLLRSLQSKKVLAAVDRWLFDEPTHGDIGTIVSAVGHFLGKISKEFVLESENERKTLGGIGQMLRIAQQKTLSQMVAERTVKGHGILEQLWRKVDKVKHRNPFLAKTLAIWADRMPFLVDRLFDEKVGAKNCTDLVEAIRKFCEWAVDRETVVTSSWKKFCSELHKLEKKEQAQLDEEFARCHAPAEEKTWVKFSSPTAEGSGAANISPKSEVGGLKVPKLELPMNFTGIANAPTLNLNASRLMNKRLTKTNKQNVPKMGSDVKPPKLNVPILKLNAARLAMKRLTEGNGGTFAKDGAVRKETMENN